MSGVGFIKNSALADTKNVAPSTPIAHDVLTAAITPPTAGPIMLPIRLFDNGRTAFIAGSNSSGTISGVSAVMQGMKTASNVPKRTANTINSPYFRCPVAMRTTRTAVRNARAQSEMSKRSRRENRSTIAPPTKRKTTNGVIRAAANQASFDALSFVVSRTSSVSATRATPSPNCEIV